jgi:hypothetical protein
MNTCDRCEFAPATVRVRCWVGCVHAQCRDCAAETRREAVEEHESMAAYVDSTAGNDV